MKQILLTALLVLVFTFELQSQCLDDVFPGGGYTIAKKTDGTLWASGQNNWGATGLGLSDGSSVYSFSQIAVPAGWQQVSTGYNHVAAVKNDGTLWVWGSNQMGQLGLSSTEAKISIPTKVGTQSNWKAVAAGANFTLAIKTNGTLWAWGMNNYGQLGTGNFTDRNYPVQVGSANNWSEVWAGGSHGMAKTSGGTLYSWGYNAAGQLANGTTIDKNIPTVLPAYGFTKISLGNSYGLALKADGTMWAWGSNYYGTIGDATFTDRSTPVQIGNGYSWTAVSAGGDAAAAIRSDKTIWTWGNNDNGQLGLGLGIISPGVNIPTKVGSQANWALVKCSWFRHMFAINSNGEVWSWGSNNGALANGGFGPENQPVPVSCAALGLTDGSVITQATLYPNPASDILNIKAADGLKEIKIFDLQGRLVHQQKGTANTLYIYGLTPSVYLAELHFEGAVVQQKFVKK